MHLSHLDTNLKTLGLMWGSCIRIHLLTAVDKSTFRTNELSCNMRVCILRDYNEK